jgi:hypothetical protein
LRRTVPGVAGRIVSQRIVLLCIAPLPAFGRSRVSELDVVPLTTRKVLTWDLVCFPVPTSRFELVWKAVRARHP